MSNTMVKMGPLAGFLAAVAYCVWPLVWPSSAAGTPRDPLPEIEAAWLRPDFGPPADRDPFRIPGTPSPAEAAAAQPGDADGGGKDGSPARDASTGKEEAPPPEAEPPVSFRLGGTLVAGGRRLAIIDGRVYRQGEPIEVADPIDAGWRVELVEAGRVLLTRPMLADPIALEFADPLIAAASAARPGPGHLAGPGSGGAPVDARSELVAAGIPLPGPSILEHLADQSGGTVPGAYRALLNLLVNPPQLPSGVGAAEGSGSEGGASQ